MKPIVTFIALAIVSTTAFAQRVPQSASYKELKSVYSPKEYSKSDVDPYSVFWIGLESFAVPGSGQLIMKETGRGWAFLGTNLALATVMNSLGQSFMDLVEKDAKGDFEIPEENKDKARGYLAAMGGVLFAQLGVSIWSCIDAVKVAKVKNQYYQETRGKHAFSATLHPSVDLVQGSSSVTPAPGMTLAFRF